MIVIWAARARQGQSGANGEPRDEGASREGEKFADGKCRCAGGVRAAGVEPAARFGGGGAVRGVCMPVRVGRVRAAGVEPAARLWAAAARGRSARGEARPPSGGGAVSGLGSGACVGGGCADAVRGLQVGLGPAART